VWNKVEKKKRKTEKVVVITPKNDQTRIDLKKSLRHSIDSSKLKLQGVSNVANNGIAVRCDDDDTRDELINKVKNSLGEAVDVKKPKAIIPRVKILKINDPEENDDDLIAQIKHHNSSLLNAEIEVIRREQVKFKGREIRGVYNIIIQLNRDAYDEIMKNKKIKLHFEVYKVVDNIFIRRCYNCCGFNHFAKSTNGSPGCQNALACSKCSLPHKFAECTSNFVKCINCVQSNDRAGTTYDVNHDVWSKECSVYKIKLERSKRALTHIQ
jgi:hypothetical protein